mgnify:CR=1 FL=1
MIIRNQEEGRAPIEFSNILSSAKVVEMKGIKPNEKCRSFAGLYQDSQSLSVYHERQKFGIRAGEEISKTVKKATFKEEVPPQQEQPKEAQAPAEEAQK